MNLKAGDLESTRYKQKCNTCLSVWKYESDCCPECGGTNLFDFHASGCECRVCTGLLHIVKLKEGQI